ncbi:hypothetical protein LSH36_5g16011 [Paralvinella palmiformis]|uniref:Intimal thickness related receptor IRP domain-containing protein n=1 Tax=Paralvinella palmiformis TaxID=53620 RepID=A0AAD9KEW8_9ANNE|nr:hypothetical protein LSH36_5g16011 [Paralvinella palmiformis]
MILLPQNCWQKEAVLRPENYQIIYLTLRHFWSGCKLNTTARIPYYRCTGSRVFLSARERWWFVAASKCGGPQVPQFICIIFCLDVRVSSISVHKHINYDPNCTEREAVLVVKNNQKISLSPNGRYRMYCDYSESSSGNEIVNCSATQWFRSMRERWWYIALSKCGSHMTCKEKESPPHIKPDSNQKIVLDTQHLWSGCKYVINNVTKSKELQCRASRSFRSSRERWWFVAVSRCQNSTLQGINLYYRMWLTNGDNLFYKHFSADEFYILQVDIAFLFIELVMLLGSIFVAEQLKERQLFHSTYKLYISALTLELFHLLFMCVGFGNYANNGLEGPLHGFKTFGRMLESLSYLIFLLMLILMAKGFTITRGRISTSGSIKIAIFMTLYVICYAVLFIYEAYFFDPGEVLYLYESPAGYGILALRLLGWAWFLYAIFFTLKHFPEKSKFYFPFLAFYTIWFWAGPIVILVAMKAMPLWVREKTVNGVELTVTFIGHLFFLVSLGSIDPERLAILTRPSAANENFPYHVRTCQIGIMENAQVSLSNGNNGTYTPGGELVRNGAPNFTELFTVGTQRNVEMNAGNKMEFPHQEPSNNPFIVSKQ